MPRPFILHTAVVSYRWKLDYKTENKMLIDNKQKWGKMAVTLISTPACYQVPLQTDENWVSTRRLVSVAWLVFGKWRHISCSDRFKLFMNGKFTECFYFPILQRDGLFLSFWSVRLSCFSHQLRLCRVACSVLGRLCVLWICFSYFLAKFWGVHLLSRCTL